MLRLAYVVVALSCILMASAVELRPVMATIVLKDGKPVEYAIFSNNVDKVMVGKADTDTKPASSVDWKRISHIEYEKSWRGTDYSRSMGALNKGDFDAAITGFGNSLEGKSEVLRVESHLGQAMAYAGKKDFANAIAVLEKLTAAFPRHRDACDFHKQMGEYQIANGAADAAETTAKRIDNLQEWAPRNIANAALLRANIAKASGKPDVAIATITAALGKIDGESSPDAMSGLAFDLVGLLMKGNKFDEAIAAGLKYQWWPNKNPDISAGIHDALAESYLAKEDYLKAFHHAVIAASIEGVSPNFSRQASASARRIFSAIKKANPDDEDLLKKYQKALNNL